MPQSTIRRLAAILSADAVGFTARVSTDELAALRTVKASLEVLERVIGLHGGRVVKRMGDGLLAEFGSVVNAVSAAATSSADSPRENATCRKRRISIFGWACTSVTSSSMETTSWAMV